jgi:hypothetical protein
MTPETRRELYLQAIAKASQDYGYQLVAVATPRVYGHAVMVEASFAIEQIAGWHRHDDDHSHEVDHAAPGPNA